MFIPETVSLLIFFVFGAIIGSFLNVVIYRFNTGRGIGGRSACFSCRRTLMPSDLIPVLSFIFLRGKCRGCKSAVSFQYPLVEIMTGFLFAGVFYADQALLLVSPIAFTYNVAYHLVIMSILVVILVYDLKHKIIPRRGIFQLAAPDQGFTEMALGAEYRRKRNRLLNRKVIINRQRIITAI